MSEENPAEAPPEAPPVVDEYAPAKPLAEGEGWVGEDVPEEPEQPPAEAPPAEESAPPAEESVGAAEAPPDASAELEAPAEGEAAAPPEGGEPEAPPAEEGGEAPPPAEGGDGEAPAGEEAAPPAEGVEPVEGAAPAEGEAAPAEEGAPVEGGEAPAEGEAPEGEGGEPPAEWAEGAPAEEAAEGEAAAAEGAPAEGAEAAGEEGAPAEEAAVPEGEEGASPPPEAAEEGAPAEQPPAEATEAEAAAEAEAAQVQADAEAAAMQAQAEAEAAAAQAVQAAPGGDDTLQEDDLYEMDEMSPRQRLLAMHREASIEAERLAKNNESLQKKLALYFSKNKKAEEAKGDAGESKQVTGNEQRYLQSLQQVSDLKEELRKVEGHYERVAMDMKTRLERKEADAREIRDKFVEFKREIAKSAENSRTGKPIALKLIMQFEQGEQRKESDVEKVRLKNIHLRNQMRKLESSLRAKEELADGLHLIDFEQLKIENQTLNEKIEERNEELLKLRKKTQTTVQVLTHVKEKLQFVLAENQVLKRQLQELEGELTAVRDRLSSTKQRRDTLRSENLRTKQTMGMKGNVALLLDFDARKALLQSKTDELAELKQRWGDMQAQIARYTKAAAAASAPFDATAELAAAQ